MPGKPSIVIVSSSSTRPKSLIKLLTKRSDIEGDPSDDKVSLSWSLDTKYYTADVDLIGITEHYQRSKEFNENVEALIIHMDANKQSGLEDLNKWTVLEEDSDPEIKLLIANYFNDTKITKARALDWCLKHGYELVELYPAQESKDKEQDVIEEKFGVERIVEALQAHTWSNLVMKSQKQNSEHVLEECGGEEYQMSCDGLLDDFSDLFAKLNAMKDSLQSLPVGQRKQCAQQVVTAFWKAIGGEEEEILDI